MKGTAMACRAFIENERSNALGGGARMGRYARSDVGNVGGRGRIEDSRIPVQSFDRSNECT